MKHLTGFGLVAISVLFAFGAFYIMSGNKDTSTGSTQETTTIPPISDQVISEIPDDGQAHIVYIDPSGHRRIMVKIIRISNLYRSHIIWVEYMNEGRESIEHLGGTH